MGKMRDSAKPILPSRIKNGRKIAIYGKSELGKVAVLPMV
jgi:hypothetical protein